MVRRRLTPLSLFLFLEISFLKEFSPLLLVLLLFRNDDDDDRRRVLIASRLTSTLSLSLSLFPLLRYKQARKGIHPLLRRVQYVGTNGQTYQLWSTVKHHQDRFFLSQDQYTHPAWTGIPPKSAATGQAAKFKRRGFDFLSGLKGRTNTQQQQGAKKQPTKK